MEAAWSAGRDFFMPMGHADDSVDTEDLVQASTESAIPASNRGYALLQRLGWTEGKGLGRNEDGGGLALSALCVAACGSGGHLDLAMRSSHADSPRTSDVRCRSHCRLARMLHGWAQ